jgi:hypothetical protein
MKIGFLAMFGAALVATVAACGTTNNIAQCGPGTKPENGTCVAANATSSSSGSSSSSGEGSSSGNLEDGGAGDARPADCPTEVTDEAKGTLVLNCDPQCGGNVEVCRHGPGEYGQMLCRPAGVAMQPFLKLAPLLGDKWRKILVRLPKNPWEVYGPCDPMAAPDYDSGFLIPEYSYEQPRPKTVLFVLAQDPLGAKEAWYSFDGGTAYQGSLEYFRQCTSDRCRKRWVFDPIASSPKRKQGCQEALLSPPLNFSPGQNPFGIAHIPLTSDAQATTFVFQTGRKLASCGGTP